MPPSTISSSFIPKSSFEKTGYKSFYKQAGLGFVFKITAFLLVLSLAAFGGTLLYKKSLNEEIAKLSAPVERAKAAFDPAVLGEMEDLVASLKIAENLVANHRFPSHIFKLLEDSTYEEVRFSSFGYAYKTNSSSGAVTRGNTGEENSSPLDIILKGEARSYTAMAKQAEVFKNNPSIEDAVFSNFELTSNGDVAFTLRLITNPTIVFYE